MKFFAILFSALWVLFLNLSFEFQYGHDHKTRPILLFVGFWIVLFFLLCLAGHVSKKYPLNWKWVIAFGLFFRVLMVFSNPIQEDDFYRYLWDGAVLAEGVNPYKFSPAEIKKIRGPNLYESNKAKRSLEYQQDNYPYQQNPEELLLELENLGALSQQVSIDELHYSDHWMGPTDIEILDRVNNPEVTTVYPPVAQGVFYISALIKPGSLVVLRLLFVLVEALTLFLLAKILMVLKSDPSQVLWYAWNPLVIKEFINSPHLDVLMVCAAAALLYFWVKGRYFKVAIALAIGILAKFFIAPIALFFLLWQKKKMFWPSALTCFLVLLGFMIFSSAGSRQFQGLKTMAITGWNKNSIAVECLEEPTEKILEFLGSDPWQERIAFRPFYIFEEDQETRDIYFIEVVMRRVLIVAMLIWVVFCLWKYRRVEDKKQQIAIVGLCLTGIFLLSPVANPWYAGILMFFLPFIERKLIMIVLGAVLSLYYLNFYLSYNDQAISFHNIVLLEGLALVLAFGVEWIMATRRQGEKYGSD